MTTTAEIIINAEEVLEAFIDCLYRESELTGIEGVPGDAILVEGIMAKFGFQPARLEEKRDIVTEWLAALPEAFRKDKGGGWSFLNACNQENGVQWTGLHERMEQLFCLGMGLGLVKCQLRRDLWAVLPGGMPYYAIDLKEGRGGKC